MGAATIGIQTIMPQTGTGPQQTPPPPSGNESDSTDTAAATTPPKPAPPPPGMGKYVDRLA
jgi:hypothetical protein